MRPPPPPQEEEGPRVPMGMIVPRQEGGSQLPAQMRCAAHTLNLVGGDLEKKMDGSVAIVGYKKFAKSAFHKAHLIWRKQGKKISCIFINNNVFCLIYNTYQANHSRI